MSINLDSKKSEILKLVSEFVTEKTKAEEWKRGEDWVAYSGPIFDASEYLASIETMLGGWMIFGKHAREFEKRFPEHCTDMFACGFVVFQSPAEVKEGVNVFFRGEENPVLKSF